MQPFEYAIVIPTNRSFAAIAPLLRCVAHQTILPKQVIIVYDKDVSYQEIDDYNRQVRHSMEDVQRKVEIVVVSRYNFPTFVPGTGVSYMRNFGINEVITPLLCCVDDDNEFDNDFMQKMIDVAESSKLVSTEKKGILMCPTEEYHKTGKVRSRGYVGFNYWLGKTVEAEEGGKKHRGAESKQDKKRISKSEKSSKRSEKIDRIAFCSSNCLFGHKEVFCAVPFDERVSFVYEDFIMTKQVSNSVNFDLRCARDIRIHHMMRDKKKIQDLYIHSPFYAYQKSRNRILFVRETSTWSQQIVYFLSGLRIHTFYLIIQLIKAQRSDIDGSKWCIFIALMRGIKDGILWKKREM